VSAELCACARVVSARSECLCTRLRARKFMCARMCASACVRACAEMYSQSTQAFLDTPPTHAHRRLLSLVDENPAGTEYGDGSDKNGNGSTTGDAGGGGGEGAGDWNGCGDGVEAGVDICTGDDGGGVRGEDSAKKERRVGQGQGQGQEHGEEGAGGLGLGPGGEGAEEGMTEGRMGKAELGEEAVVAAGGREGFAVAVLPADGTAETEAAGTLEMQAAGMVAEVEVAGTNGDVEAAAGAAVGAESRVMRTHTVLGAVGIPSGWAVCVRACAHSRVRSELGQVGASPLPVLTPLAPGRAWARRRAGRAPRTSPPRALTPSSSPMGFLAAPGRTGNGGRGPGCGRRTAGETRTGGVEGMWRGTRTRPALTPRGVSDTCSPPLATRDAAA
jgi:hypothetical protein